MTKDILTKDRALIYLIEKKHSVKSLSKAADLKIKKYFKINTRRADRVELSDSPHPFIIEVVERPLIFNSAFGTDSELNDITYYYEGLFEWQLRFKSRFEAFGNFEWKRVVRILNPETRKYLSIMNSSLKNRAILVESEDCQNQKTRKVFFYLIKVHIVR